MEKHREVEKIQEVLQRHHLNVNTDWKKSKKSKVNPGEQRGYIEEKGPSNNIPQQIKQTLE